MSSKAEEERAEEDSGTYTHILGWERIFLILLVLVPISNYISDMILNVLQMVIR